MPSPQPVRSPIRDMDAETIARKAMAIAAEICVYTNNSIIVESLDLT